MWSCSRLMAKRLCKCSRRIAMRSIALLDVVLRKLSGPEICARIRNEKPDLPPVFRHRLQSRHEPASEGSGKELAGWYYKNLLVPRFGSTRYAKPSIGTVWSLTNKVDTSFARMIIVKHTWHRFKRRFAEASRRGTPKFLTGCISATNPTHPGRWKLRLSPPVLFLAGLFLSITPIRIALSSPVRGNPIIPCGEASESRPRNGGNFISSWGSTGLAFRPWQRCPDSRQAPPR
jgi:hypothetical protein